MNDYFVVHIYGLFMETLMAVSLMGILLYSYFREKLKMFRFKILKVIVMVIAFLLSVILGVVNLLSPVKVEIYRILAPSLLLLGVITLIVAVKCCFNKINKIYMFLIAFFISSLVSGLLKISIFNINPMIFVLIGLFGTSISLALFITTFLIRIIGGNKKNTGTFISKISKKRVLKNGIVVIVLLIAILSSVFILSPKYEVTSELVIYSWYDYFTNESIESFEKEYGVNVTIYNYGEEPTMEREIENNPGFYDIVILSDEYVKKLYNEGKLQKINKRRIPRFKNIGKEFLDKNYDPNNKYSVPYLWGTTGILLNKNYILENDTWGVFFDPRYSGKIFTLLGPTDAIGVASSYLGYGYVPTKSSQLLRIEQFLEFQKSLLLYEEDEGFSLEEFSNGTVWASQFYSGDALVLMENNENLTYIIPKEGSVKWIDNFVILKGAKNKNTAELFINHILDPMRSAEISNFTKFPTSNVEAVKYIDPNLLLLDTFNPSPEIFDRLVFVTDFNPSEEIEKLKIDLWERIK